MEPAALAQDRQRALSILRAHGRDATSFQLLERGYCYFFAEGGFVAYFDIGPAWVAGGSPVAPDEAVRELTHRFFARAALAGKRASFFAVSGGFCEQAGLSHMHVGEEPFWLPGRWPEVLAKRASLRYQLRRAQSKGVRIRRVAAAEMLSPESPIRSAVEGLVKAWLDDRPLAPMGFLVELDVFGFAEERLYLVAEQQGRIVAFLAAVPIYARSGWLIEDVLRERRAPNGTVESLIDGAMRHALAEGSEVVSLGLAPLAGPVGGGLRLAREVSAPLFDFRGLAAFKSKLMPDGWEPMFVAVPGGQSRWLALFDGLRAFARGSFLRFGFLTLLRGPALAVWALTAALLLWTPLLGLAPTAPWFPSPEVQRAWVVFDVLLACGLLLLCFRPRAALARALMVVVALDATLTLTEALIYNVPRLSHPAEALGVAVACVGPLLGALVLRGSARRLRQRERSG